MADETLPVGATSSDDTSGLLQAHLTTRNMRNAAEAETISRAYDKYVYGRRRWVAQGAWMTEKLLREIHKEMFGEIWDWAGRYRRSEKNIGIAWHQVAEQMGVLCQDFLFWFKSKMSVIEMGARVQHRLTYIHPFENGNGRHARLVTDMVFRSQKHPLPRWPQIQLQEHGDDIRRTYINSMRRADQGDYAPLIQFITDCLA